MHDVRRKLNAYPRNPILWTNLARLYTSLGVQDKATRAMRVALSLAPENRFILRAASRLCLHQGEPEEAHQILLRAPNLTADPWLLAAEIATASARGKTSRLVKTGRNLLESPRHSPFDLSELASALGTLEIMEGNRRAAHRLITVSLGKPTENSIAASGLDMSQ